MGKLKYGLLLGLVVVFLTACVSVPIGDGNKVKVSKEGIVLTTNDGSEHTISFDTETGSLYIDGFGMEDGFGLGATFEIPEAFPADIPIPEDAKVYDVNEEDNIIALAYKTEETPEMINNLYTKHFSSDVMIEKPKVKEETSELGPTKRFQGIRKDGSLDVNFSQTEIEEVGTLVAIVFQKGEKSPSKEFPGDMFRGGDPFKFPGDMFNGNNPLDWFPGDMFDDSEQFPGDMFDDPEQFPGDMFDNPEQITGDAFQKKARDFMKRNLPDNFLLPDNFIVYQANDLLGVTIVAFETDEAPELLDERFREYFQGETLIDKPTSSEIMIDNSNVRVLNGNREDGEINIRYSSSKNVDGGSKAVIVFKKK